MSIPWSLERLSRLLVLCAKGCSLCAWVWPHVRPASLRRHTGKINGGETVVVGGKRPRADPEPMPSLLYTYDAGDDHLRLDFGAVRGH